MVAMNKIMDPQKTAQTMREFEMQNAKMEMTDEMSKCSFLGALYSGSYVLRFSKSALSAMC